MLPIELRRYSLAQEDFAAFATKKEAQEFARKAGWPPRLTARAYNRFWLFWIVRQVIGTETMRVLKKDLTWKDIPVPESERVEDEESKQKDS
jgi:hypothetical protein